VCSSQYGDKSHHSPLSVAVTAIVEEPLTATKMQACDRCHRRKSRCDKVRPRCGVCEKSGAECSYSDRSRDPSIRKEHVEGIERRLRQEEAKNQALSKELARMRLFESSRDRERSHPHREGVQVRRDCFKFGVSFISRDPSCPQSQGSFQGFNSWHQMLSQRYPR
jgi:hypothetical protein